MRTIALTGGPFGGTTVQVEDDPWPLPSVTVYDTDDDPHTYQLDPTDETSPYAASYVQFDHVLTDTTLDGTGIVYEEADPHGLGTSGLPGESGVKGDTGDQGPPGTPGANLEITLPQVWLNFSRHWGWDPYTGYPLDMRQGIGLDPSGDPSLYVDPGFVPTLDQPDQTRPLPEGYYSPTGLGRAPWPVGYAVINHHHRDRPIGGGDSFLVLGPAFNTDSIDWREDKMPRRKQQPAVPESRAQFTLKFRKLGGFLQFNFWVNTQASSLTALHPKPPDGSMAQLTYDWVTELKGQWWRFPEGFRPSIPRFFTAVCERNYTHQEASPDSDEGGFPLKSKRGVALFRIDPDGWANLLWGFYPVWFNQRQPPPNDQTAPNVTVQNMADYYVHDALVPL